MLAAALTTIFFSISVLCGARSAQVVGPQAANLGRITLATLLLGIWAHGYGAGLSGPSLSWFFLSGVIGFGLGDMALFGALPRIGPRLAILLTQCLAAPIAAFAEWIWLGTTLRVVDLSCAAVILVGVAVAMAPDGGLPIERRVFWIGVLFGVGSALGQALGAVVSRKANDLASAAQFEIDGGTAAYQRALGGLILTWLAAAAFSLRGPAADRPVVNWRLGFPLIAANALAGPTIGVGCYQWALKTTPSGLVLPIVATSPLITMLLAWWFQGIRPTRRVALGSALAVAGAVALARAQAGK
ncbi:MAG: hypothetical protein JWQ44_926 [Chthoniobacter sp.]|jgi:drug/metabolite transporter (DMT)-like permease|nr:hypothetical protein [Chthoniobacter sp.]